MSGPNYAKNSPSNSIRSASVHMTREHLEALRESHGYAGDSGKEYSMESIERALSHKIEVAHRQRERELSQITAAHGRLLSLVKILKAHGPEFITEDTLQLICKELKASVHYFANLFGPGPETRTTAPNPTPEEIEEANAHNKAIEAEIDRLVYGDDIPF